MSDVGLGATLQLEITDALARIDQLGAKLAEATTGIPVVLDDPDASAVTQTIDQAVGAADSTVVADADADAVTPAIDSAVEAADGTVPVDADTSSAETALGALGAEAESLSATVPVDADVSAADAAIADVASTAEGTDATITIQADSSQIEELTGSLESLKGSTSSATGLAAGLGSAIGNISPETATAVAGVGALVEVTKGLFESGVDAIAAEQRLALATGAFAGAVDKIHVGTLNTDIKGLAAATGSTVPPLENAISRIFTLGNTSGESGASIAQTSSRILALAGDLRVTNPALGETGQIADTLTNALARGGRALNVFGISLTAAQINQEAMNETGKTAVTQLTNYEKSAAAAKLATDQLGGSFRDNFAAGQNNPVIQIGQIKAEVVSLFEALGRPLVSPVLDLLRDLLPLAKDLGTLIATVVEAVLPLANAIVDILGPPLHVVADILSVIPPEALLVVGGLAAVTQGVFALAAAIAAIEATNPVLAALEVAVGALAVSVGAFRAITGEARSDELRKDTQAETAALVDQDGVLQLTTKALKDYIDSRDKAGQSDIAAKFHLVGVSVDAVTQALLHGKDATDVFGKAQGAAITLGPIHLLKSATDDARNAYTELTKSTAASALAQLDAAVSEGVLTQKQVDHAIATRGTIGAYQQLGPVIEGHALIVAEVTARYQPLIDASTKGAAALSAVNAESSSAGTALAGLASAGLAPTDSALVTFALGMNSANLSTAGLDNAAIALGITTSQLTGFLQGVSGALNSFVGKVVSGIPTVADAFKPVTTTAKAAGGALVDTAAKALQAQRAVEDAQHGIVTANRGVEDSALSLTKANEGVQKSVESLTNAQKSLADAEQALADARQGPKPQDVEQANINLERARLGVIHATDGVVKAEGDLNNARNGDGTISTYDAELNLEDARLTSREAALRVQQAEDDLNTVRQTGTEADKNVVSAEKAVADAHDGVTAAQQRLIDSQHAVVVAQRGVEDAAYAVVKAQQALQTALNPPATGGGGGGGGAVAKQATVSLQEFVRNLDASTAKTKKFFEDIQAITAAGGTQLAGEIAQLGVTAGFGYAEQLAGQIAKGDTALTLTAEKAVEDHNATIAQITVFLRDKFGPEFIATSGLVADLASAAFGKNLSFTAKLKIENAVASGEMTTDVAAIALIAGEGGTAAAEQYGKLYKLTPKIVAEGIAAARAITGMPLEGPSGDKGDAVAVSFGKPITDPATGFGGSVQTGFGQVTTKFNANKGPLEGLGTQSGDGILQAFVTGIAPLPLRTQSALDGVGGVLAAVPKGPLPGLGQNAGDDVLSAFVTGVAPLASQTGAKVADAGPQITRSAKVIAALDATLAGGTVGTSFSIGVAIGMSSDSANRAVDKAAHDLVARIESKAKTAADAHSPSRRFALFGADLTAGIAEGITSNQDAVVAAAEAVVRAAAERAQAAVADTDIGGFAQVASRFTGAGFDPTSVQQAALAPSNLQVQVDMGGFTFTPDTTPEQVAAVTRTAVASAVDTIRDKRAVFVALTMAGRN